MSSQSICRSLLKGGLILIFRQMTSTVIAAIASILVARCARVLLNSWN